MEPPLAHARLGKSAASSRQDLPLLGLNLALLRVQIAICMIQTD